MVDVASLSTPQDWSTFHDQSEETSVFSSLKDGMKSMIHDLRDAPRSKNVADWSEFPSNSGAAELSKEKKFFASTPKEVVKVLHQDTVIRQPAHKSTSQVSDDEVPAAYLAKLQHGPSAGLRWFRQPSKVHDSQDKPTTRTAQTQTDIEKLSAMNATEIQAKAEQIRDKEEPESADSLAKSLSSEMIKQKKHEELKRQRAHLPTGIMTKQLRQKKQEDSLPETSAMDSIHRKKNAKKILPIRPEDVHHEAAVVPQPEEPEEPKPLKLVPARKITPPDEPVKAEPSLDSSSKDGSDDLFTMHAVDGLVDANAMDAVLEAMGSQKKLNWQRFDLDGDGSLSHTEFNNAMKVARRFKAPKA